MINIYLLGACISGLVWVLLTRARLKGYRVRFVGKGNGDMFSPLQPENVNYSGLMAGTILMAIFWPVTWSFILLFYVSMVLFVAIELLWSWTLGNDNLARKVFGADKEEK